MARLTTRQRNSLQPSDFAYPKERKFPIQDRAHAEMALEDSKGTTYEAGVRAAVAKRYPNMKVSGAPAPAQEPDADDKPGYSGPGDGDADDGSKGGY